MSSSTAAPAPASGSTFRSLRHRNARLFFVGLLVSNVGTWMQLTATSLLVYRLTGRTTDVGVNVALQFLPMLLLGAWAGAVADRVDKRVMTLCTQAALAAQALVLGALDLSGSITLAWMYALSLVLGVINALDNPARRGFVIELVERDEISNAVSLNTAVMTGSRIFGPAIAAVLVGPLGTGWMFVANGVTSVAILLALLGIDRTQLHPSPRAARGGTPVRDALRYVRGEPRIFVAFVVFTIVSTFGFNYGVSLPKLADQNWGGEEWFGWTLAVTSVGSLLGSLQIAARPHVTMRVMAFNGLVLGTSGVILAWAPNIVVAMLVAVPLGLGGAGFVASMNAITQQECPPQMRGRILALTAVAFLGSTPIGGPITGWVGDHVSAEWAMAYGAIISLVAVGGLIMWLLGQHPELRSVSALRELRAAPATAPTAPVEHP
jgi:MFS family permease